MINYARKYVYGFMSVLLANATFSSFIAMKDGMELGISAFTVILGMSILMFAFYASFDYVYEKLEERSMKGKIGSKK